MGMIVLEQSTHLYLQDGMSSPIRRTFASNLIPHQQQDITIAAEASQFLEKMHMILSTLAAKCEMFLFTIETKTLDKFLRILMDFLVLPLILKEESERDSAEHRVCTLLDS